jgi:hypothetical protein
MSAPLLLSLIVALAAAFAVASAASATSATAAYKYTVPVPDPLVEHGVVFGGELRPVEGGVEDVVVSDPKYPELVPDSWDWRKFGYMTTDLNQHIPTYW